MSERFGLQVLVSFMFCLFIYIYFFVCECVFIGFYLGGRVFYFILFYFIRLGAERD